MFPQSKQHDKEQLKANNEMAFWDYYRYCYGPNLTKMNT